MKKCKKSVKYKKFVELCAIIVLMMIERKKSIINIGGALSGEEYFMMITLVLINRYEGDEKYEKNYKNY